MLVCSFVCWLPEMMTKDEYTTKQFCLQSCRALSLVYVNTITVHSFLNFLTVWFHVQ